MGRWFTYIKERFQLIPQVILIGGMTLIAKPQEDSWVTLGWVFSSLLLFFFLLRAMDEYKDYEKDCVASKTGIPLPHLPEGWPRHCSDWPPTDGNLMDQGVYGSGLLPENNAPSVDVLNYELEEMINSGFWEIR